MNSWYKYSFSLLTPGENCSFHRIAQYKALAFSLVPLRSVGSFRNNVIGMYTRRISLSRSFRVVIDYDVRTVSAFSPIRHDGHGQMGTRTNEQTATVRLRPGRLLNIK